MEDGRRRTEEKVRTTFSLAFVLIQAIAVGSRRKCKKEHASTPTSEPAGPQIEAGTEDILA